MASSGNFSTMNPLHYTSTNVQYSNGNLTFSPNSSWSETTFTRNNMVIPKDKKIYFEVYYKTQSGYYAMHGLSAVNATPTSAQSGSTGTIIIYNNSTRINGTRTDGVVTAASQGDVIGIAIDGSNNKVWFAVNNTWQISGDPANGTNEIGTITTNDTVGHDITAAFNQNSVSSLTVNFGQDSSFGGDKTSGSASAADGNGFGDFYYTPPTGFLALCSGNLSVSDDIDPAQTDDDFPQKQFNVLTYTGNATTGQSLTGLGFKPDLIWAKMSSSSQNNQLYDSSRMNTRGTPTPFGLRSDTTGAEFDDQSTGNTNPIIASFDTDGFTLGGSGSGPNDSGRTYVAWCWRANGGTTASNTDGDITSTVQANTNAGFSIVTYTGDNTDHRGVGYGSANIGHGLDSAPEFIITKRRNATASWYTLHASAGVGYLTLNDTTAFQSGAVPFGPALPTATTFGAYSANNNSGATYINYCWHSVEGYSKFGSYTGNGNSDGPFIYTGFRPRFVLTKGTSSSGWNLRDSARSPNNTVNKVLQANTTSAEMTSNYDVQFFSNGFKILATAADSNSDGNVYAYGAWGDVPFKYNNTF